MQLTENANADVAWSLSSREAACTAGSNFLKITAAVIAIAFKKKKMWSWGVTQYLYFSKADSCMIDMKQNNCVNVQNLMC